MDDGYLIHEDVEYLRHCLARIREVCAELGIVLNEKKTRITPLTRGFNFLKKKFTLTPTGRVLCKPDPSSARRMKRKLYAFRRWVDEGIFTPDDARFAYTSWRGYMSRLNARASIRRMDERVIRLFGGAL
jgi:hypothetical protein